MAGSLAGARGRRNRLRGSAGRPHPAAADGAARAEREGDLDQRALRAEATLPGAACSASSAWSAAIELGVQERSPYPDGALFLDADAPELGRTLARALDESHAVVLCYADGARRIVQERAPLAEPA
jgi:hypothetical protein